MKREILKFKEFLITHITHKEGIMSMKRMVASLVFFLGTAVLIIPASADIVSTTGAVTEIVAPASVVRGNTESDTDIFLFEERQHLQLQSDVSVNITQAGTYVGGSTLTPGIIMTGTFVNSYFIHFDQIGQSGLSPVVSGSVTFDREILGLIALTATLNASDSVLGAAGTSYGTGDGGRRVELDCCIGNPDTVTLSPDRRTLTITLAVLDGNVDEIRVITSGEVNVLIDIKPGSDPNCFNNNGHGVLPVAIFGGVDFDVSQIDAETIFLEGMAVKAVGKSDKLLSHIEDVDADGFDDLVVQIQDSDGAFQEGDTTAVLTGSLLDGTPIKGTDTICIVP